MYPKLVQIPRRENKNLSPQKYNSNNVRLNCQRCVCVLIYNYFIIFIYLLNKFFSYDFRQDSMPETQSIIILFLLSKLMKLSILHKCQIQEFQKNSFFVQIQQQYNVLQVMHNNIISMVTDNSSNLFHLIDIHFEDKNK